MAQSPLNLLFICSRNRLRSPTGEALYASVEGVRAASAGTAPDAEERVSSEWIEWADVIFAMESRHKKSLLKAFPHAMKNKRVLVLNIPDDYDFMDPQLCSFLRTRVDALLGIDSTSSPSNPPSAPTM
jgi:predicted protein tyrosine phosphatase